MIMKIPIGVEEAGELDAAEIEALKGRCVVGGGEGDGSECRR